MYIIFSYSASVSIISVSSSVSLILFKLPSLVRTRVPSETWASRGVICSPTPHSSCRHHMSFPQLCHESLCWHSHSHVQNPTASADLPFRNAQVLNLPLLCNVSQTLYFLLSPAPFLPFTGLGFFPYFSGYPCSVLHYISHLTTQDPF